MSRRTSCLAIAALLLAPAAHGHAIKSAHWQLEQVDARHWQSRLRLPEDLEGNLLTLQPRGPEGCERLGAPQPLPADGATILHWRLRCADGPRGALALAGFSTKLPDAVVQLQPLGAPARHAVLSAAQPQWRLDAAAPPPVAHYLPLGIAHILLGPDHLLFVLGLWALWRQGGGGARALAGTLTAFTIAHSLTLAGAALYGWRLPLAAVEACIAASILLVAVELATGARGPVRRAPARIAFAFGLLHGFGFAGALAQTGLPDGAQGLALAAFNVGVELGQLGFVLAVIALARVARPLAPLAPVALCAYGSVAAAWLIARSAPVLA